MLRRGCRRNEEILAENYTLKVASGPKRRGDPTQDRTMNEKQIEIYRRMTPAERLKVAFNLHDFAHKRVMVHLKRNHPNLSEKEINVLTARRFLGDAADVLGKVSIDLL